MEEKKNEECINALLFKDHLYSLFIFLGGAQDNISTVPYCQMTHQNLYVQNLVAYDNSDLLFLIGFMGLAGQFWCLLGFIMLLHSIGKLISFWGQQDLSLYSVFISVSIPVFITEGTIRWFQRFKAQKLKLQDLSLFTTSQWSEKVTRPVQIQRIRKQTPFLIGSTEKSHYKGTGTQGNVILWGVVLLSQFTTVCPSPIDSHSFPTPHNPPPAHESLSSQDPPQSLTSSRHQALSH